MKRGLKATVKPPTSVISEIPTFVATYAPMKRGLKEFYRGSFATLSKNVATYAPMKRGLKATHLVNMAGTQAVNV